MSFSLCDKKKTHDFFFLEMISLRVIDNVMNQYITDKRRVSDDERQ